MMERYLRHRGSRKEPRHGHCPEIRQTCARRAGGVRRRRLRLNTSLSRAMGPRGGPVDREALAERHGLSLAQLSGLWSRWYWEHSE